MSPNMGSSKFLLTMICVVAATVLAVLEIDSPESVYVAAIAAYNGANAWIKSKNGGGNG